MDCRTSGVSVDGGEYGEYGGRVVWSEHPVYSARFTPK